MSVPLHCVVDTNVPVTANGVNQGAPESCVLASATALQAVMAAGHVFIDSGGLIVEEYAAYLSRRGQPGPGDAFFKWLLTNEWGGQRVTRVPITKRVPASDGFVELPDPPKGIRYDPSDRMFLAVAAAHSPHPPILQSFDSKWWGWRDALAAHGVVVHFLCSDAIAAKYAKKTGG